MIWKKDYFAEIAKKFDEKRKLKNTVDLLIEENQAKYQRLVRLRMDYSFCHKNAAEIESIWRENHSKLEKERPNRKEEINLEKKFELFNLTEIEVFYAQQRASIELRNREALI